MLIPDDEHGRTVKVPVRIVGGAFKPFYGGPWPPLKEGTIGDVIMPTSAFIQPHDAAILNAPLTSRILRKWVRLLVGVNQPVLPTLPCKSIELEFVGVYRGFVELHLRDNLYLKLRGTKRACLLPCDCYVPSLRLKAASLNEAYMKISESYEPWRRSHTGNAFTHMFFKTTPRYGKKALADSETVWESLDSVRRRLELRLESRFQVRPAAGQQITVSQGTS
ncbi:MAG: hypothetical protein ACR2NS_11570 [Gemmatimonadaceae bacterium]